MGRESERHARIEERIRALHARRRRPEFVDRLAEIIGERVDLDDFLPPEATEHLKVECAPWLAAHNVQRRTWSSDLRDEMVQILAVLREQMSEASAYLLHTEDYLLGAALVPVSRTNDSLGRRRLRASSRTTERGTTGCSRMRGLQKNYRGPARPGFFMPPVPDIQMKTYVALFGIAVAAGLVVELLARLLAA